MSAALGLRVKSGWATAALLKGPINAPHLVDSRIVELSDPQIPQGRQPYHAGIGTAQIDVGIIEGLIRQIERFSRKSLATLVRERRKRHRLRAAGIVVSSLTNPETIGSPHMRAHASEGRLFRAVTADGLHRSGLKTVVILEREIYERLGQKLRRTRARVRAQVAELGDGVGRWRAEQKVAAAAAWLALAGG
jgi:hypothetical protein